MIRQTWEYKSSKSKLTYQTHWLRCWPGLKRLSQDSEPCWDRMLPDWVVTERLHREWLRQSWWQRCNVKNISSIERLNSDTISDKSRIITMVCRIDCCILYLENSDSHLVLKDLCRASCPFQTQSSLSITILTNDSLKFISYYIKFDTLTIYDISYKP